RTRGRTATPMPAAALGVAILPVPDAPPGLLAYPVAASLAQNVLPNVNWTVSVSAPSFLRNGLARLITIGPIGARHMNEMPADARRSFASNESKSLNTLPTSTNSEKRVVSSFFMNGVGKMTSAVPTVLNAPPSGCRHLLSSGGQ